MIPSVVATLQDNSVHGEDTYLTRDLGNNSFLDAVMDGVTNHGGGEASQSLSEALAEATISSPGDVVAVLKEVNEEFFQTGGGRYLLSTVSVALFLSGRLYIISAGDSPVYLVRPGNFRQLTGRLGGFLPVGAARALGVSERLDLTHAEVMIEPGDRLVLATDGVSDNLSTDELYQIVREAPSASQAAEQVNNTIAALISEGRTPSMLGGRYRRDDRTAIFRFFELA
jgi:serine/threonine protein phosphatase PrpC